MLDEKPFLGDLPFPDAGYGPISWGQHDEKGTIAAADPQIEDSNAHRPGKLRAIRRREEPLELAMYRSWQDVVRQQSPVKEPTPFQPKTAGKLSFDQASLKDEKHYVPLSSDSEGYRPDMPANSRARKRKLTATSIKPRGVEVRNVNRVKDEEPYVKTEDAIVKDAVDIIKLEHQTIKSEDDDSEEKYWDFVSSTSESEDEPDGVTIFDIVAGRVGIQGFLEDEKEEDPISVGDYLAGRQAEVAPEQKVRPFGARLNPRHALPTSDLLKAIHAHASDFYDKMEDSEDDFQSMDETALICMAILLEESVTEVLDETGYLSFLEHPSRSGEVRSRDRREIKKEQIKEESDIKEEPHVQINAKIKTEPASAQIRTHPKIEPGLPAENAPKAELGSSDIDMNDIEEYRQEDDQQGPQLDVRRQENGAKQEERAAAEPDVIRQDESLRRRQQHEPLRTPEVDNQGSEHKQEHPQHAPSQQGYHSDVSTWISQTFQHPQDDPTLGPWSYIPPPG